MPSSSTMRLMVGASSTIYPTQANNFHILCLYFDMVKLNGLTVSVRSRGGHRESQKRWTVGSFGGSSFFVARRDHWLLLYSADCGQEHCWGGRLELAVGVCSC